MCPTETASNKSNARWQSFERIAERYLLERGLELIERNYASRAGEIDLVMRDGRSIVFVEVRYRKSTAYGTPLETVTRAKQRKLAKTAAAFLQAFPRYQPFDCRFDIVGIVRHDNAPRIDWLKGAFYT